MELKELEQKLAELAEQVEAQPYSKQDWAVVFMPLPLPQTALQTSFCTHLLAENSTQTLLGMGMGMNVTAQGHRAPEVGAPAPPRGAEGPEGRPLV